MSTAMITGGDYLNCHQATNSLRSRNVLDGCLGWLCNERVKESSMTDPMIHAGVALLCSSSRIILAVMTMHHIEVNNHLAPVANEGPLKIE